MLGFFRMLAFLRGQPTKTPTAKFCPLRRRGLRIERLERRDLLTASVTLPNDWAGIAVESGQLTVQAGDLAAGANLIVGDPSAFGITIPKLPSQGNAPVGVGASDILSTAAQSNIAAAGGTFLDPVTDPDNAVRSTVIVPTGDPVDLVSDPNDPGWAPDPGTPVSTTAGAEIDYLNRFGNVVATAGQTQYAYADDSTAVVPNNSLVTYTTQSGAATSATTNQNVTALAMQPDGLHVTLSADSTMGVQAIAENSGHIQWWASSQSGSTIAPQTELVDIDQSGNTTFYVDGQPFWSSTDPAASAIINAPVATFKVANGQGFGNWWARTATWASGSLPGGEWGQPNSAATGGCWPTIGGGSVAFVSLGGLQPGHASCNTLQDNATTIPRIADSGTTQIFVSGGVPGATYSVQYTIDVMTGVTASDPSVPGLTGVPNGAVSVTATDANGYTAANMCTAGVTSRNPFASGTTGVTNSKTVSRTVSVTCDANGNAWVATADPTMHNAGCGTVDVFIWASVQSITRTN